MVVDLFSMDGVYLFLGLVAGHLVYDAGKAFFLTLLKKRD